MHERVFSFPNGNIFFSAFFRYSYQKGLSKAFFLLAGLSLIFLHSFVRLQADSIKLRNGNTLRGDIVSQNEERVVIQLPYGRLTIERDKISEIRKEEKSASCVRQARDLVRIGSYKRAIRLYKKAVSLGAPQDEAREHIENAFVQWLDVLAARRCYETALRIGDEALREFPKARKLKHLVDDIQSEDGRIKKRLTQAAMYLDVGKYSDVLKLLDDIVEHNPYLTDTAGVMAADAHYGLGEDALVQSDYKRAAVCAEKAMRVHAKKTDVYMNLYLCAQTNRAVIALNKGNFREFRTVVELLSRDAPQRLETFFFQGLLAERNGNGSQALRMYQKMLPAFHKNGAVQDLLPVAREKATKLFQKKRIKSIRAFTKNVVPAGDKVRRQETAHFIINGYNRKYIERVGMAAEFHLKNIVERFTTSVPGKLFSDKITIHLFPDKKTYLKNGTPGEWSSGVTKVLLSPGRKQTFTIESFHGSSRFMQTILPHELGHAVLYSITAGKRIPLFLHEGVAVSAEPELRHRYLRHLLRQYAAVDDLISAETLLALKKYTPNPGRFYAQSYAVFDLCKKAYGERELMKRITSLSPNPAQKEILHITGMKSFEALDKALVNWALSE